MLKEINYLRDVWFFKNFKKRNLIYCKVCQEAFHLNSSKI